MYLGDFSKDFIITAFIEINGFYKEVNFSLKASHTYYAFFIKRIN